MGRPIFQSDNVHKSYPGFIKTILVEPDFFYKAI